MIKAFGLKKRRALALHWKTRLKKAGYIFAGLALCLWLGAIATVSGTVSQTYDHIVNKFLTASVNVGFSVQDIVVVGRQRTDPDLLRTLLDTKKGDPILAFDPQSAQKSIEDISWIKTVSITRRLPDTIIVDLIERQPLALWQQNKKLNVIDENGVKLTSRNLEDFNTLPIIVGADAPKHAPHLIGILNAEPSIAEKLDAAVRVSGRRWDLHLQNGIKVRLPEQDMEVALKKLAYTHATRKILNKNILSIDLRLGDKLVIKPVPGEAHQLHNINKNNKSSI